jgi:hypothetical protein
MFVTDQDILTGRLGATGGKPICETGSLRRLSILSTQSILKRRPRGEYIRDKIVSPRNRGIVPHYTQYSMYVLGAEVLAVQPIDTISITEAQAPRPRATGTSHPQIVLGQSGWRGLYNPLQRHSILVAWRWW